MGLLDDIRSAAGAIARLGGSLGEQPTPSFDDVMGALRKAGLAGSDQANTQNATLAQPTDEMPRAMFHDPYSVVDWGGWRERPSTLTYETLRVMAMRNTVISAIIQLRTWQVAQFARPQQSRYDKGYRIVLRDRRDKKKTMTPAEMKVAVEIEKMLETTGYMLPGEQSIGRDNFRTFLKKSVRDILIYDQWCFEKIRDRRGKVSRFICLPAETIRPAVLDSEHMDPIEATSRVSHVQVYEDSVIAEFAPEDIAWCVMNPRSDLRVNTFGLSPIELLIQLVTAWLFGFEHNQRFFSQGSAVKGVLNIKGAIPDRQLRAFRRMWYAQVSGVTNAWRTPILNADDIQWLSMHSTNREMEFAAWMDWLTKLTCAVYGVDPVEINFVYGNTGQSSTLAQPDNEKRVVESKDKGLRPLMDHIVDSINQHIIWDLNPDFELDFVGLDAKSEESEREARIKEVTNFRTIDEVRSDFDEPALPDGLGKLILNPTFMQWAQQKEAAAQQGAPGGGDGTPDFGLEGDDDGGEEPDFGLDDGEEDKQGGPAVNLKPGGGPQALAGGPKPPGATPAQPKPPTGAEDGEEPQGGPKPPKPPKGKPFGKAEVRLGTPIDNEIDNIMKSMQVQTTQKRGRTSKKITIRGEKR